MTHIIDLYIRHSKKYRNFSDFQKWDQRELLLDKTKELAFDVIMITLLSGLCLSLVLIGD